MGLLGWAEQRYASRAQPREVHLAATFYAWCEHRSSEDGTHLSSPTRTFHLTGLIHCATMNSEQISLS